MTAAVLLPRVVEALGAWSYLTADEATLQTLVASVLASSGIGYERERRLDPTSRIDFWLPTEDGAIGLELKVDGSPTAVLRQLLRYAAHPDCRALVLMTTRARVASRVPPVLSGVPVRVVTLWEGQV